MKSVQILNKIKAAAERDPELLCDKEKVGESLGHNPDYLLEVLGITKSDLIRLERVGLAFKARYEIQTKNKRYINEKAKAADIHVSGTHRTRWIIFKEALGV